MNLKLIGRFIVDFLINHEGKKLIVEADGQQYHVPDKDKLDEEIYNEFQMEPLDLRLKTIQT